VQDVLCEDDSESFLTVESSYFGVMAPGEGPAEPGRPLCHLDYERRKERDYPDCHVQVPGQSDALDAWGLHRKELGRLHFPADGYRYRLILEDVIQFLVAEGLAKGRRGWRDVLAAERGAL
jgi:hypothetical protein